MEFWYNRLYLYLMSYCHFCKNCGGEEFTVERIPKINFIDIDYAVLVKEVVKPSAFSKIQTWVDLKTANYTQELLMQYL